MQKRILSLVLCLCMILSLLPIPTMAAEKHPFTDVSTTDWFNSDVQYVYEHGLMNGISSTTFAPYRTTQRGMIVTILYRLEGSPTVASACPFTDVPRGSNYENAIIWAAANSIVTGYNSTTFGPYDNITRQQMAAILYRYAQMKGYRTFLTASLSEYTDSNRISNYARIAMAWANREGLINGYSNNELKPTGNATRAQAAAILTRFCENVVPKVTPEETTIYTVTFDLNYDEAGTYQVLSVKKGEKATAPVNPTRNNYRFLGWYTASSGGIKFNFNTAINATTTLYARWDRSSSSSGESSISTVATYTVTFISAGSTIFTQTVTSGNKVNKPNDPVRDGYVFGGWYINGGLTVPYDFDDSVISNITLYAKWNNPSDTYYSVNFSVGVNGISAPEAQHIKHGEYASEPLPLECNGYQFAGWFEDENESDWTNTFDFEKTPITKDLALYAIFVDLTTDTDNDGLSDALEDYVGTDRT